MVSGIVHPDAVVAVKAMNLSTPASTARAPNKAGIPSKSRQWVLSVRWTNGRAIRQKPVLGR